MVKSDPEASSVETVGASQVVFQLGIGTASGPRLTMLPLTFHFFFMSFRAGRKEFIPVFCIGTTTSCF